MKTKQLMLTVLGLVIVGGGVYFVMMNGASKTEDVKQMSGPTSLQALMALGIPQKCDFTDVSGETQTSGTVYVAGGKARGDFTATSNGQTFNAHSITESETMYSWVDEQGMGVKMAVNKDSTVVAPATNSKQFDDRKELDYHCTVWVPDASKFEVPTNITFTTVNSAGSITPGTSGTGTGSVPPASATGGAKANACTACDSVPEAYRAQCKAAAGC
jgi:hypothetical protein